MEDRKNKEECNLIYAALKLIERLYIDGQIEKHVYENAVREQSSILDISCFKITNT